MGLKKTGGGAQLLTNLAASARKKNNFFLSSTAAKGAGLRAPCQESSCGPHPESLMKSAKGKLINSSGRMHLLRVRRALVRLAGSAWKLQRCSTRIDAEPKLYVPKWGLPVAQGVFGTVTEVLCEVGSRVFEDETVLVVETDKLAFDVKASRSGVVSDILVSVGDEVVEHQPIYALLQRHAEPPQPLDGTEAAQRERRWAVQHMRHRAAAREEKERQWSQDQEERQRQQQDSPYGFSDWRRTRRQRQGESSWHDSSSSSRRHRQETTGKREGRNHGQSAHHEQHRFTSTVEPKPLSASEVGEMPLTRLVERVLLHKHNPPHCLGLRHNTSSAVVRRRYLQLALRLHPDKSDHVRASEAFTAIDDAFKSLRHAP